MRSSVTDASSTSSQRIARAPVACLSDIMSDAAGDSVWAVVTQKSVCPNEWPTPPHVGQHGPEVFIKVENSSDVQSAALFGASSRPVPISFGVAGATKPPVALQPSIKTASNHCLTAQALRVIQSQSNDLCLYHRLGITHTRGNNPVHDNSCGPAKQIHPHRRSHTSCSPA